MKFPRARVQFQMEYSISSRRNPIVRRRGQRSLRRPKHDEKVGRYSENHFNSFRFDLFI
ncbi:hypothetical protein RchiOBHm_Chr7g0240441 [Rosa chinensis]|uniref:Uncharacterized protein n=1 Tax=Rosa chinensis TaxID=74649 RepID=A0A2P6PI02_ROSCH|nr:hypothetical protein RchiOBHm_Chr7g0240441 [Rosa chinensis]